MNDTTQIPTVGDEDPSSTTMAFITDSMASEIAVEETVRQLIAGGELTHAIIETSTMVGLSVARAILDLKREEDRDDIGYSVLDFGQHSPAHNPEAPYNPKHPLTLTDSPYLTRQADKVITSDADGLHAISARIMMVPRTVGSGQGMVDVFQDISAASPDFTPVTLVGHIASQIEIGGGRDDVFVMDPPERGLVQQSDGSFVRRIIRFALADKSEQEAPVEDQES